MKIEMGESLLYSWLRHVKECQIVQTNWKASKQWELKNKETLKQMKLLFEDYYQTKYGFAIFRGISLDQTLKQAEIDVIGIHYSDQQPLIYAIDVAFHEGGLIYGQKGDTGKQVIKKLLRTALCIYGYFDISEGEIIFASPKVNNAEFKEIVPLINEVEAIIKTTEMNFHFKLIANNDFESEILSPILVTSKGVADTSELFMRSYQLYRLFRKPID